MPHSLWCSVMEQNQTFRIILDKIYSLSKTVATSAIPITCHNLSPHKFLSIPGTGVVVVGLAAIVLTLGDGINTSFCAEHGGT